jgi:lysyl-tRNA synthetase class 2
LLVKSWTMATKALLPIPSEFYGLEDAEEKMRKRYLDAIVDHDVYKRFETRAKIIKYIRNFFDAKDFLGN